METNASAILLHYKITINKGVMETPGHLEISNMCFSGTTDYLRDKISIEFSFVFLSLFCFDTVSKMGYSHFFV